MELTTGLVIGEVIDGETWREVDSEETVDGGVGLEVGDTTCVMDGGGMLEEEVEGVGAIGIVVEGEVV